MEVTRGQARSGGDGLYFRPIKARATAKKVRHELEGLWIIYQATLLHPLDLDRWVEIFETTVSSLLSEQPLQSLPKRARLGVVMSIVGSGRTHLHTPAVLAVLATDWNDEWASFKLLQETVRQASLSHLGSEWGLSGGAPPGLHLSRKRIADLLCLGVEKTVSSWRALRIGGSARDSVEKAGRELRGLAARCRGSSDQPAARKLLSSYLASHRVEQFTQALISWGQERMGASKPTIFDQALPFLRLRQIQASRSRADARRETQDPTYTKFPPLPAAHGPSLDAVHKADTQADTSRWEQGKETEKSEGSRKKRKIGTLLRLDESVIVRKKGSYGKTDLWRRGAIEACRGDGTYDIRYDDDGEIGHLVRRQDLFGPDESDVSPGMLTPRDDTSAGRSPLKRPHTISRAPADDVSPLPPRSPMSEEHTTAGSTSPRTTTDDADDSWCVTHVDDDSDVPLVASGTREGNHTRLIQRRNRKRRVFPDDESEDTESRTAASDADSGVREPQPQPSLSRFSDEDDESSQPLLRADQARSEGVAGSQAGQEGTRNKERKEDESSYDGVRNRETDSGTTSKRGEVAHDNDEGGAEGVDVEDDETDEELTEGTCRAALEEEEVETDEEVETRTRERIVDRRQSREEDGEADAGRVGEGVDNRADDVVGSSPPLANEMLSKYGQQIEPSGERASGELQKNDNEEVLRVRPPTNQGTTHTDDGQDTSSEHRHGASPRDEGTRNGVIDGVVDIQPPGRPTHFMRVYGSAGIARVRESMAAWFSQRTELVNRNDAP